MANFVYAMFAGNFVKIGVTSSIKTRIKQVQTGSPLAIHKVKYFNTTSRNNCFEIEKILHKAFINYKTFGEWFSIQALDEKEYISYFKESIELKLNERQTDRSVNDLINFYRSYKETDRDKLIKRLVDLKTHVESSESYYYVYESKESILKLIDNKLKSIIRYSSKNNIKKVSNSNKKMDKFKQAYPWLYTD